jgi:hypothetical protein
LGFVGCRERGAIGVEKDGLNCHSPVGGDCIIGIRASHRLNDSVMMILGRDGKNNRPMWA